MIEFSKDHGRAWMEMMSAYQIFRAKLFDWAHELDQIKQKDLLLELDSWENRELHRRMLVVDLLRSTEMWEVLRLAAVEEEKAEPDPVVFHNGCLLLHELLCAAQFSQYTERYGTLIEQAYGLDENGLADIKKTLSAAL